jgi:hypothetical protein
VYSAGLGEFSALKPKAFAGRHSLGLAPGCWAALPSRTGGRRLGLKLVEATVAFVGRPWGFYKFAYPGKGGLRFEAEVIRSGRASWGLVP